VSVWLRDKETEIGATLCVHIANKNIIITLLTYWRHCERICSWRIILVLLFVFNYKLSCFEDYLYSL